ncbi:putative YOR1-ABC transporter [Violaceomyces palustris]|uniref:YOR1-ABC transporter n=1 Tax=Violaceomyces palustris TaxID=1673888 RepID=A0ACD0P5S6_9BASI|nr:putative YOR1-ABC transporter [Violaceomyces palustris]
MSEQKSPVDDTPTLAEVSKTPATESDASSAELNLDHSDRGSPDSQREKSIEDLEKGPDSSLPPQQQQQQQYRYNPGQRNFEGRHREKWYQVWLPKDLPPPPPLSLDDAKQIPLATAGFFDRLVFQWMTPIMVLGHQRPLEATDLWKLTEDMSAKKLSTQLNSDWEKRVADAKEKNRKLQSGETPLGWRKKAVWSAQIAFQKATRKPGVLSLEERESAWRAPPPPFDASKAKPKTLSGHVRPSLALALHEQVRWKMWSGLVIKIIGDTSQVTSPLVLKQIIKFAQQRYAALDNPALEPPHVGKGIGLAFGLFFMQLLSSLCMHQFFWRSMSVGVESRAALISAIFQRALKMNGKARASGKLVNHISTDCSRIDFAAGWFTVAFAAPIQIIVCLIILITQIGPSALAGFAIFVLAGPLQTRTMKSLFVIRRASMQWTDKRSKTIQEVLGGMRIVKSFSHESKFLQRISEIRRKELSGIRKILIIRSANNAIAFSLPVLAAVLAFVIYSLTGHDLNPAVIFTSLTLFQLLRMPLMFLPLCLSATTDAMNAFERLHGVFTAEQLDDSFEYEGKSEYGLVVENASFRWETVEAEAPQTGKPGAGGLVKGAEAKGMKGRTRRLFGGKVSAKPTGKPTTTTTTTTTTSSSALIAGKENPKAVGRDGHLGSASGVSANDEKDGVRAGPEEEKEKDEFIHPDDGATRDSTDTSALPRDGQVSGLGAARSLVAASLGSEGQQQPAALDEPGTPEEMTPFSMEDITVRIPKGELVAIVGPVGSGKSSLLQACIGEMRKTSGRVTWGSERVAYCSQSAWIQNATVRDNILFGQGYDEERYWEAVRLSELESDLAMLPAGDKTEIGEKGVNLSGGQKQRVNIARALYYNAEIYCFDDPLSAVDAHVGKALFYNAIMGLRKRNRTVLLVTHALHFLPDVDRIITLEDGKIVEQGTYPELLAAKGAFSRLVDEFGGEKEEKEEGKEGEEKEEDKTSAAALDARDLKREAMTDSKGVKSGALIKAEERNTGSVSAHVYYAYLKAGKGWIMIPVVLGSVCLMQTSTILNSYWLIWWQENRFSESQGFYMGIYAGLGIAQTIFTFVMGTAMGFVSYYACRALHDAGIKRVVYAPMSWLDVTPIGRIMNLFSKDIDVIDNQLADAIRMATNTFASVLGAVILITILTHYFVVAVAAILVFYYFGAVFYRSSAREVKRLDAILRSSLYSHFSETLSGLATIRAYRETPTFLGENQRRMDIENRAYYMSVVNQRWLGIRLDFLGALLVLIVAILTTAGSSDISGGQVGVALSYILQVSQAFSWMTRQVAEVENDMASTERIVNYSENLEQEAAQQRPDVKLAESWPEKGEIEVKDVWLNYRPGLPPVLKGISFQVKAGEKVGIVGRTGAGKSSMLVALLRLVELERGSISIDGVNLAEIGLEDLRRRIAILPQEPLLFSGTIRSNLDPFGQYDDARLWDAMKRAYLVSDNPPSSSGSSTPLGSVDQGAAKAVVSSTNTNRINLDTPIEEEGANLSVGQRSLVSLARALVKNSRIILLDEATASVDLETDSKIQTTIREEFSQKTILCIAHRLRTILSYDRIAVFHQGQLAEYDSPLNLFDRAGGIFHEMCQRSNISREDIIRNKPVEQ